MYNWDSICRMDLVLIGSVEWLIIYWQLKNTQHVVLYPWPLVHYVVPCCHEAMAVVWVWDRKSKERAMLSLLLSCRTPMSTDFVSTCSFRSFTRLWQVASESERKRAMLAREDEQRSVSSYLLCRTFASPHSSLLFYLTESKFLP